MTHAEIAIWIVITGLASFATTYMLATRPSLVRLTALNYQASHAIHSRPTPRTGGMAVVATALIVAVILFPGMDVQAIVFSCLPIVLGGLLEDLGIGVSPRKRLALAALCCLLLYIFSGTVLDRVGLPGVDVALSLSLVGLTFTVFLLSGVTHAFNLVDGLNGLLAVISTVSSLTLAALAVTAGDQEVAMFMILMASITVGFGAMNFPSGKVFMGDTGSYFLGFSLGATGVYLISRHDDLSPWSVLLALFWPLHETVLTIARRAVARKRVFSPDQEHTHHLVLRLVRRQMTGRNTEGWENPMSTVVLLPFILAPNIFSLWSWNDPSFGLAAVLSFLFIYTLGYVLLRSCASDRGRG
jgi:UDP-GlcNAc:undecaprenyl-phosphate/decaprenyl-phosphate GlcNAc-1-phosphate transferase